jgi:hypothetical protein
MCMSVHKIQFLLNSIMILAIDFDDTIATTEWPEIKGLRKDAKRVINQLYEDGHQIIIWTCRDGIHEQAAKDFLDANDVRYHRINENCPERVSFFGNDCRKIGADLYIDDKGILGLAPWSEMYDIISAKQIELNQSINVYLGKLDTRGL